MRSLSSLTNELEYAIKQKKNYEEKARRLSEAKKKIANYDKELKALKLIEQQATGNAMNTWQGKTRDHYTNELRGAILAGYNTAERRLRDISDQIEKEKIWAALQSTNLGSTISSLQKSISKLKSSNS